MAHDPPSFAPAMRAAVPAGVRALAAEAACRLEDVAEAAPLATALGTITPTLPLRRPRRTAPVPGLQHLPAGLARGDPADPLVAALRETVGQAAWTSWYDSEDRWATWFVHGFATGDLVGPSGPWISDRVQLGSALYGPGLEYPPHGHPAVEAYLIVAGHATGGIEGTERELGPGDIVVHPDDASHRYRVGPDGPLLLVWVRAGDLGSPTWASLPEGGYHHPAAAPDDA